MPHGTQASSRFHPSPPGSCLHFLPRTGGVQHSPPKLADSSSDLTYSRSRAFCDTNRNRSRKVKKTSDCPFAGIRTPYLPPVETLGLSPPRPPGNNILLLYLKSSPSQGDMSTMVGNWARASTHTLHAMTPTIHHVDDAARMHA